MSRKRQIKPKTKAQYQLGKQLKDQSHSQPQAEANAQLFVC